MRSLPLAALLIAAAPFAAAAAAPPPAVSAPASAAKPADWRRSDLDGGSRDALRGAGYRLEEDGRVLDPKTLAPLSDPQLKEALAALDRSAGRLALERLSVLLAKGPLSAADRARVEAMKGDLPPSVVQALDAGRSLADLRAATDGALARAAAVFDGARTPADAAAAAAPVAAGTPGPRVSLPYFTPQEKALGDALRASAASALGRDPYGRSLLAKLKGPDGKPDLPPVVVEEIADGSTAVYQFRRGVIVLDREGLLSAATGAVPPPARAALRRSLSSRAALIGYLNAHPALIADFAKTNDVVIFHELVHAWQDRRDAALTLMSRGVLPDSLLLDYEQEAWTMKNLYLGSKLKNEPGSVVDDAELDDYKAMTADPVGWARDLRRRYSALAPVQAMDFAEAQAVAKRRESEIRARRVSTADQQTAKALDLLAMTRAEKALARARTANAARLAADRTRVDAERARSADLLARHYLAVARAAENGIDFSVAIGKAEDYARAAGDLPLLTEIRDQSKRPAR
jgi:hypothetical protein